MHDQVVARNFGKRRYTIFSFGVQYDIDAAVDG